MSKSRLLAGVMLVGVGILGAATVQAETLEEALATAYNNNPTLQARRARVRSVDETVPQALSNWRPTVTLSGDVGRGKYFSSTSSPSETKRTPRSHSLKISQPLYRGGRTVAETAEAEANVQAERSQLRSVEQTILLNAATAYLNTVRDEAVVRLNINNEQVLRRQLEAARERFRVGEITRTDVAQAEARMAGAIADRVAAEGTLQTSRANYINIIGRAPETPQAPQVSPQVPGTLDEVKAVALAKNPNIQASDWAAKAAKERINLVGGELLPTVSLNGDYSRGLHTSTTDNESTSLAATVNLSVPIYEGGAVYSRLRAQKHTFGQKMIESDQARRDTAESSNKSFEELLSARAQIRSLESQIKASEVALAGVEEEAKVGSRTVLDVLDAEQELFDARVRMVRAQRDEMVAAFQVKSALGQMTAEGLGLSVELYDPEKNYKDTRGKWIGTGIDPLVGYQGGAAER